MAQWLHMFTGKSHLSRVRDRAALLERAVANWNAVGVDDRTLAMRKKLQRLADDLLRAIAKEKRAFLNRTVLDEQSETFKSGLEEIEDLLMRGPDAILQAMGASGWNGDAVDFEG